MEYEYDPFNRIQSILYPDSELVEYSYNLGGMLSKVTGSVTRKVTDLVGPMQMHGGSLLPGGDELMGGGAVSGDISGNDPFFIPTETIRYSYIDSIVYNEFELKDSVVYGNGTRVRYAYDSLYRLVRLRSYTAEDELMQDIAYHYDSVGNILDIENMAATLNNGLGGAYRQEYTYDNLYRLDNATGWWECRPDHLTLRDTVDMRYSKNGRIIRKQEYAETFKNSLLNLVRYDRQYQYSSPYSNKLGSVTDAMSGASQQFGWDGCGNMVRHGNPEQGCDRRLSWTEDNRLQFVKDNGSTGAYYQYDAGGDRTYKLLYHKTTGSLNGVQTDYYTLDDATLYVSPYLVVTPQGYTKHYYAESERITTQLGKYRFTIVDSCVAGDSLAPIKLQDAARAFPTDSFPTPTPMLGYLHSLTNHPNTVSTLYFYHPDHLGSASWITNIYGRTIQHLYYLPWGEDFVNQRTGSFSSMYTFSAKEKDAETGYSYFGARYYSSDLSIWLSVDPMASKYPSLSPYVYCADNPVKMVDPNGKEVGIPPYIKDAIANAITSTAENAHALYLKASSMVQNHPWMVNAANLMVLTVATAVSKNTNMNPQTMSWLDLTNIWLFELDVSNGKIQFGPDDRTTRGLKNQEGVTTARTMAINNICSGVYDDVEYTWEYDQEKFYEGVRKCNIVTSFLGSYTTQVTITKLKNGKHLLNFTVTNTSGWESATRLRKDNDGNGQHDGIIPNKKRGDGIKLGGNLQEVWQWTEEY